MLFGARRVSARGQVRLRRRIRIPAYSEVYRVVLFAHVFLITAEAMLRGYITACKQDKLKAKVCAIRTYLLSLIYT